MIRDRNIEWLEKRIFLPAYSFSFATADAATRRLGSGTLEVVDLTPLDAPNGSVGALFTGQGQSIQQFTMLPYDLDPGKQVRFRVHWMSAAAAVGARTITWLLIFTRRQAGGSSSVPIDATASGLDTDIPTQAPTGIANTYEVTDYGVLNKNRFNAPGEFDRGRQIMAWIPVIICTFDASFVENKFFLGLEMCYTPRRTGGPERNLRGGRRLTANTPFGVGLSTRQEG